MKSLALLTSTVAALGAGVAAAETRISYATGLDYSSGKYGESESTEVASIPLAIRITNGGWSVRASTSYMRVSGPADIADLENGGSDSSGSSGGGGSSAAPRTGIEQGFGDTTLSLSRTFERLGGSGLYVEASGRVRLPTGDDSKGLGVGVTDFALAAEVGVNERAGGASLQLTRRFLGERDGAERNDGWQLNSSAWLRAGQRTQIGAFGSWREATATLGDDPAQAGAFVSHRLTSQVRLALNASVGLSEASPDYSGGLRLTWRPDAN
jgi:hypothetical protein